MGESGVSPYPFPSLYDYGPMWTLQRNLTVLNSQLKQWSNLVQSYCRHHRLFRLTLADALKTPLFHNAQMHKRLSARDVQRVLDFMAGPDGGRRAEWVGKEGERSSAWIYWRRPEEWADMVAGWVEETGQKGVVLTLWELREGESTISQEFHEMDPDVFQKALHVLVRRGKAQIFGEDQQGIKFF
jgi:ESCRT-II complex subunit VPS25